MLEAQGPAGSGGGDATDGAGREPGGGAGGVAEAPTGSSSGGRGGESPRRSFAVPPPVAALRLAAHQGDVFGLGLALEAVTLTANHNAVRHVADCSVSIETVVHRPVWLTGL